MLVINMRKLHNFLSETVPLRYRLPLILVLVYNSLAYYIPRLLVGQAPHMYMGLPLDRAIPFLPWTVSIYFICYLFWAVNYILVLKQPEEKIWQFFSADFLSKLICFACFVLFPATLHRPQPDVSDFWGQMVAFLYQSDAADNLFPSIHCLASMMSYLAVAGNPVIPKSYRAFSLVFALLVCLSTLTTRQHVILDVISGISLAFFCCFITKKTGFARLYERQFSCFHKGGTSHESMEKPNHRHDHSSDAPGSRVTD